MKRSTARNTKRTVEERIEEAVFGLMETTDIPNIKVADVVRLAGVSRSTFYRHYDSVEDVVKQFEAGLLDTMRTINNTALGVQFNKAELKPTQSMVALAGEAPGDSPCRGRRHAQSHVLLAALH